MRIGLALFAVLVVACGNTVIPAHPRTTDPVIGVASRDKLGDVMTADGMTVYVYTKDLPRESVCYDTCAMDWPPLIVTHTPTLSHSFAGGSFGSVTRKDGSRQLTYKNQALYLYIEDPPGTAQANGQNVDGVWFIVHP